MKTKIFKFLFGNTYKEQPWSFWGLFWKAKAKEVGTVLGVILLAVIAYGALLWFPSSLVIDQGPEYFYKGVYEVSQITNKVTVVTNREREVLWVKFPVCKDVSYAYIGLVDNADEASDYIRNRSIGKYTRGDAPNMVDSVREAMYILGEDAWGDEREPTFIIQKFIKEFVKEWKLEKVEIPADIAIDYDITHILGTNIIPVMFNGARPGSWVGAHGLWIAIWGIMVLMLLLFSIWFTSNYTKLTKKKKRK